VNAARVAVLALAVLVLAAPAARADGDPASDVLYTSDVFLPFGTTSASLVQQVAGVYRGGERIKVAVIASPTDLGSIPSLFGKPDVYAKFLAIELSNFYVGPLLVVMPAGLGFYDGATPAAAAPQALGTVPVGAGLVASASAAVDALSRSGALQVPDVLAPTVEALTAIGKRGSKVQLRYFVIADSERATTVVRVLAGTKVIATLRSPERTVLVGKPYATLWRASATGNLRFCVTATSPAGKTSRASCAAILLG
jgi:hypothetical protein